MQRFARIRVVFYSTSFHYILCFYDSRSSRSSAQRSVDLNSTLRSACIHSAFYSTSFRCTLSVPFQLILFHFSFVLFHYLAFHFIPFRSTSIL